MEVAAWKVEPDGSLRGDYAAEYVLNKPMSLPAYVQRCKWLWGEQQEVS